MKKKGNVLSKAETWADNVWHDAYTRWSGRSGQDKSYRWNVIHPAIVKILEERFKGKHLRILDLGCGDGVMLDNYKSWELMGNDGFYLGIDVSPELLEEARKSHQEKNVRFIEGNLTDPDLPRIIASQETSRWDCILSVFVIQEIPDIRSFLDNLAPLFETDTLGLIITVHPDFAEWLKKTEKIRIAEDESHDDSSRDSLWQWAGYYPIVDEPTETFYLPHFQRSIEEYRSLIEQAGMTIEKIIELPEKEHDLPHLVKQGFSPFTPFESNVYWPRMGQEPSSVAFIVKKKPKKPKSAGKKHARDKIPGVPPEITGNRSWDELRDRFMELLAASDRAEIRHYSGPELFSYNRVTYIIPPITDIEHRADWKPGDIYVVRDGSVAIGSVCYTRTSGEYLVEELMLKPGDIFGEFEVPLSILRNSESGEYRLPPRFNMTYGAWASGPALNWAMAYPRQIIRDSVVPENAKVAVHPFYIKSKNIRPETNVEIILLPVEDFEEIVGTYPEALTWFLMNVLRKTRLYFEPPSQGYGLSPVDILSRLFIRILIYRIRLGCVVTELAGERTSCRTFIGPTEWLKYSIGPFVSGLKEIIHSVGGTLREPVVLPIFSDELKDLIEVTAHFPVKDLDDKMLSAMGCSPEEDRRENRYGLLTGIKITLSDLDYFNRYLLEKGE